MIALTVIPTRPLSMKTGKCTSLSHHFCQEKHLGTKAPRMASTDASTPLRRYIYSNTDGVALGARCNPNPCFLPLLETNAESPCSFSTLWLSRRGRGALYGLLSSRVSPCSGTCHVKHLAKFRSDLLYIESTAATFRYKLYNRVYTVLLKKHTGWLSMFMHPVYHCVLSSSLMFDLRSVTVKTVSCLFSTPLWRYCINLHYSRLPLQVHWKSSSDL